MQEIQELTHVLYEYAAKNGFSSDSDDHHALMEMIYYMTDKAVGGDSEAGFLLGMILMGVWGKTLDDSRKSTWIKELTNLAAQSCLLWFVIVY